MVTIRKMEQSEARAVKKVAQRTFGIVERLFISRPKEAMVAVVDDKIVGGIIIKYIVSSGKKIGYFDAAFIDPDYQGQGIGGKLYRETTKYLWEQDCDALSALVKDDNVGSWKGFLNNGFSQTTIGEGIRQLGFLPMLLQYFITPFCIGNGMEFYLAVKEQGVQPKKVQTGQQIMLYLLVNFLLMLFPSICNGFNFTTFMGAYLTLLVGSILCGYVGTLFSKRQWQFRLNSGGAALVALINMGGAYPMIGNWYPKSYDNTKEFRRAMGINALFEWGFLVCITILAWAIQGNCVFFRYLFQLGGTFLIYHMFIFYPFECFGGKRVYLWNKWLYVILTILSIATITLSNI